MKKMLIVHKHFRGGGAETSLITLLPILAQKGYQVSLVLVFNECYFSKRLQTDWKIDYLFPSESSEAKAEIKYGKCNLMSKISCNSDIEVAYLEGYPTAIVSRSLNANSYKVAWIHTDFRNNHHSANAYLNIEDEKRAYAKFDHLVFCSKSALVGFQKVIGICPHQKYNIYLALPDKNYLMQLSKDYTVPISAPYFCTMARLAPEKGLSRLINVADLIKKQGKHIEFLILGEGFERAELENKIKNLNLYDTIKLLGFIENPYPYLYNALAYICPSIGESFCISVYEAKLFKKPVIACDSSGIREVLQGYPYSIIVENNTKGLVDGVCEFLRQ